MITITSVAQGEYNGHIAGSSSWHHFKLIETELENTENYDAYLFDTGTVIIERKLKSKKEHYDKVTDQKKRQIAAQLKRYQRI